ncbi:MAG: ABC-2 family transporter protein [archaeon]|jgi:ABC-2 type transport system permease protein
MAAKNTITHKLISNIKVFWAYLIINLKTILEYKTSSIIQFIAMFFNDIVWISFWWIFFAKFPLINDWTYHDLLILWSIGAMGYGLSGVFLGNRHLIGDIIVQGKLDYYLALPKNVLFHSLITRMPASPFGDLVFGIILAILTLQTTQLPLFLLLAIMATLILSSFGVIIGSLSFFFQNSEKMNTTLWNMAVGLTLYPTNVYEGLAKIVLFVIIPVGFVAGVPTEIIRSPSIEGIATMAFVTLVIGLIAIILFYTGLKRYESGNLLYVNS